MSVKPAEREDSRCCQSVTVWNIKGGTIIPKDIPSFGVLMMMIVESTV